MPSPEKVKERIQEYAKQHQLQQPTIFIDRIISEGHVQVIAYTTK
jgi:glutaredoxin